MKNNILHRSKLLFAPVLLSLGLLASCEKEQQKKENDTKSTTISLSRISGSQKGRVTSVKGSKYLTKKERLAFVAAIKAPQEREDLLWSATSVAINPTNDENNNIVYITWHSNRQATDPATQWGGAIDVMNMAGTPSLINTYTSNLMKFNHVLYNNGTLFLSATGADRGGAIARATMNADGQEIMGADHVDCIGFPGASVNAVAPYNNQLVAVSGHRGTYATFDPAMEAKVYDYIKPEKNVIKPLTDDMAGFGGKYVIADNGNAYVLYDNGEGAVVLDMATGHKTETGVRLKSADKYTEIYNEKTGEWILTGDKSDYYGKHTMAIKNGIAYIACGYNGMIGVDLATGNKVCNLNLMTIGVHIYDNLLFTATASGLRIYDIKDDGDIVLDAFEVETYDETTGMPTSTNPASIETSLRHSPNFVTYDPATGYIYIAYGQTGVRVYKFRTDDDPGTPTEGGVDMGGDIIWATENLEGYYAWGEIFNIDDEPGKTFTHNGVTYTNDGSYYTFSNTNKTSYADMTNYKFFNNTNKLTKYTWQHVTGAAISEDGLTVLESMDDAAAVRLGNGWRMPTEEEWVDLINTADKAEEITQDGVTGMLITAPNGNTIFLPQTGYYNQSGQLKYTNEYYYWSSSLCKQVSRNADTRENLTGGFINGGNINRSWCDEALAPGFYAYFNNGQLYLQMNSGNELNGFTRCYGLKIRPVKDKK